MKEWSYYECKDVPYPTLSEYADKESWRNARNTWHDVQNLRVLEFSKDLFKYHGVEQDPANSLIYAKAWEDGHSSGLHEVASLFEDYLDFLNSVEEIRTKKSPISQSS